MKRRMDLQRTDDEIFTLIHKEQERQESQVELIASENYASRAVMEAVGSILTNKYSEGYPGKRYYAGQVNIDAIEGIAIERAKTLFGAEYANVQPLSGSPANLAVFLAALNPGDSILSMDLHHGGHLSHGYHLNFSGSFYKAFHYGVNEDTFLIDMDDLEKRAIECRPKMIIAGFSAYSRSLDWKRFRKIADTVGAILFADISHIAGLIAGGALENPVGICDIVMTTTHKTLRGPRGAIIMSKEEYAPSIAKAVFPGIQGGPHENIIAAKAVALKEAETDDFRIYVENVVRNARTLAGSLHRQGLRILTGGTDNHIVLADVFSSFGITGGEAEGILESVGISCNKNIIPFDRRRPMDPSGIRLGSAAVTTRGMGEEEMEQIAALIIATLKGAENHNTIRKEVATLCKDFPIYRNGPGR